MRCYDFMVIFLRSSAITSPGPLQCYTAEELRKELRKEGNVAFPRAHTSFRELGKNQPCCTLNLLFTREFNSDHGPDGKHFQPLAASSTTRP